MKFKLASNKPDLASAIFGVEGKIHQEFNTMRNAEKVAAPITSERDNALIKEERKQVLDVFSAKQLKKYGVVIDEGKWSTVKDDVLRYALEQRYELDARYRKIIEKVKSLGLYLLYYTGASSGSELGGKRKADKTIDGENKVGKMMMEIAGFRI